MNKSGAERTRKSGAQPREAHHNWKGGKHISSNGYIQILVGVGHRLANSCGYAPEHRLVMEAKLGRAITSDEVVHHIDGNKQNNTPDNLALTTPKEHRFEHRGPNSNLRLPHEKNEMVDCACGCKTQLLRFDPDGRPRMYRHGHNTIERNRRLYGSKR